MASASDKAKMCHRKLFQAISDHVDTESDNFAIFINGLKACLPDGKVQQNSDNVFKLLELMDARGKMAIGNYGILKEIVRDFDCVLLEIIETADKEIKGFMTQSYSHPSSDHHQDARAGLIPQQTPREPSPSNQPTQKQQELLAEYSMIRNPRGICVIINIKNFGNVEYTREGTDVDRESLKNIFKKLDFSVQIHEDLTDTGMLQALRNVAHKIDHTNYDCFVCCILTHGCMGYLLGSNSKQIPIKDLTSTFEANSCPSLAGKPKLFFFQACQGPDKMGGTKIETDDTQQHVETDRDREYIPNAADFLLGYSTVPGYVSFRNTELGSFYIGALVQMLDEHGHNDDLVGILTKVNQEVSRYVAKLEGFPDEYKQIPALLSNLRKKVYFR